MGRLYLAIFRQDADSRVFLFSGETTVLHRQ